MVDADGDRSAIARVRRFARRGGGRLRQALRSRVDDAAALLQEQVLDFLSSPEQVKALQITLANIADWTLRRGFRFDPNAELLFDFVNWLEQRHGRRRLTQLLFRSPIFRDPLLLEALAHLSELLTPFSTPDDSRPRWDAERLEQFKTRTGDRLLGLLVELAALEADEPLRSESRDDRLAYFESAPIPPRFTRLAAMTQGRLLMTRETPSGSGRGIRKIIDRLRPSSSTPSDLVRFIPGAGDETLHFLVFSTTFFLQSYLLRNLIEALPDIAAEVQDEFDGDEIIDIG